MQETWRAEGLYSSDRWTQVLDTGGADAESVETWIERELEDLRGAWGGAWNEDVAHEAGSLLRHNVASDLHPGTLVSLLHWPVPATAVSRVRIVLGDGEPVEVAEWKQMGFDVDEYSGAGLGPGLRCLAAHDEEVDGQHAQLHTAVFVFAAQDSSVMVVVEASEREVFGFTCAEMPLLLSTLEVVRPDGTPFSAQPVPGVTSDPLDAWEDSSLV